MSCSDTGDNDLIGLDGSLFYHNDLINDLGLFAFLGPFLALELSNLLQM